MPLKWSEVVTSYFTYSRPTTNSIPGTHIVSNGFGFKLKKWIWWPKAFSTEKQVCFNHVYVLKWSRKICIIQAIDLRLMIQFYKMLPRIIFCFAVILAILVVILSAFLSPVAHKKAANYPYRTWLALSFYIQQPQISSSSIQPAAQSDTGAFIFHRALTVEPENVSSSWKSTRHIEHFANSAFDQNTTFNFNFFLQNSILIKSFF